MSDSNETARMLYRNFGRVLAEYLPKSAPIVAVALHTERALNPDVHVNTCLTQKVPYSCGVHNAVSSPAFGV